HGVLVGPFAGSRVGLLAGGLAVIGALTASALTASALTPGALTASALTAGALTAAGRGRLREIAEEHTEQRPAGAAHTQPAHVQRGEPAAVGGGLLGLEPVGDELHGGAHVGAEVAVAGAAVQVAERVGGAEQGRVHAEHEAAAGVVGKGLAAGHLGLLTRSGQGCGRRRPRAPPARPPAASG